MPYGYFDQDSGSREFPSLADRHEDDAQILTRVVDPAFADLADDQGDGDCI